MKRKKLALVMAAAITLTSIPANSLVGYAEELPAEILAVDELPADEMPAVDEPTADEVPAADLSANTLPADTPTTDLPSTDSLTADTPPADTPQVDTEGGNVLPPEEGSPEDSGTDLPAVSDEDIPESSDISTEAGETPVLDVSPEDVLLEDTAVENGELLIESIAEIDASEDLSALGELQAESELELQAEDAAELQADELSGGTVTEVDGKMMVTGALGDEIAVDAKPDEPLILSVAANSADGQTCQWSLYNDTIPDYENIAGATGSTYEIQKLTKSAKYRCIVPGSDGASTDEVIFNVTADTGLTCPEETQYANAEYNGSASVTMAASVNKGSISYLWYYYDDAGSYQEVDGSNSTMSVTSDENGSYLTLTNLKHKIKGGCQISDDYGNVIYREWIVYVNTFTLEHEDEEIPVLVPYGKSTSLSASAQPLASDVKLTYSWSTVDEDGQHTFIEGATENTYTISSVTSCVQYVCAVSDGFGYKYLYFLVTPDSGLTAIAETGYFSVKPGESVTLQVTASSQTEKLSYEWFCYSKPMATTTTNTYEIQANRTATWLCRVKDEYGYYKDVVFNVYVRTLTVDESDTSQQITVNPQETKTLAVHASTVTGNPISYQWYIQNSEEYSEIPGATNASYTTEAITKFTAYRCDISDGDDSESIYFNIMIDSGLTVLGGDELSVYRGDSAVLHTEATSRMGELCYQWYLEGDDGQSTEIEGATSPDYELNNVQENSSYSCRVSDGYNTEWAYFYVVVTSGLTCSAVGSPLHPIENGHEITLTVSASSSLPQISYQWYKRPLFAAEDSEPTLLENEVGNTLTVAPTESTRYICMVTDGFDSEPVTFDVSISSGLRINSVSGEQSEAPELYNAYIVKVLPGQDAALTIDAETDLGTLAYHWENNFGGEISETGSSLTLQNVLKSAFYYCMVNDGYQQTQIIFHVVPDSGLTAAAEAAEVEVENGANATLRVNASVDDTYGPIQYKWYQYQLLETEGSSECTYVRLDGNTSCLVTEAVTDLLLYRCEVCDAGEWSTKVIDFTVSPTGTISSLPNCFERALTLTEGNAQNATVKIPGDPVYFRFVPEQSGIYSIVSTGNDDTCGVLYNAQKEPLADNDDADDNPEENLNFKICYELHAGETYYIEAKLLSFSLIGNFQVLATYQGPGETTEHEWDEGTVSKTVTCTESGEMTYTCLLHGETRTETIDALGHAYPETWTVQTAATCGTNGVESRACTRGCGKTETRPIPATGRHNMTTITDQAATCSKPGSQHRECSVCGYKETATAIPPTNQHTFGNWAVQKPATCGAKGSEYRTCTGCDKAETRPINATGQHTMTTVTDQAATCSKPGSQHRECSVCGYKDVATAIPPTNQHTFGNWAVQKAATCGAEGIEYRTCTGCSKTETRTIKATGTHTFGDWSVTKEATALAEGTSTRSCTACGTKDTKQIAKLKPTITLNATTIPLKVKQSTTKLKVSGLAAGDSIVSWKSSNQKIVKVDKKGKITAQNKTGKAVITVTLASGLQTKVTVKVQKGAVKTSKITNISRKLTMTKGKTEKLEPIITPITTKEVLSYQSSNKKIATVSKKGVITAKGVGKAKITVKSGKKKVVITVTVVKAKPTGITGVKAAIKLKKGKSTTLKPKLTPNGAEAKITYKSSNTKVATVNAKGKVTAKKKGTAVITITAGSVKKTCKVTVK